MATKPPLIPLLLPEDELLCSICQALLNDPVTIPCGHNFCMTCISNHWKLAFSSVYCPHCRRKFPSKPDLKTNTVLFAIMEHIEKVWPESEVVSIPDEKSISCDICEKGRELSAVSTCVTCLATSCEEPGASQTLPVHTGFKHQRSAVYEAQQSARDVLHEPWDCHLLAMHSKAPQVQHTPSGRNEDRLEGMLKFE